MTAKKKPMTYSHAVSYSRTSERWECTRLLNPRPKLLVWVLGRVRFRSDYKKQTTIKALTEDGWKRVSSYTLSPDESEVLS